MKQLLSKGIVCIVALLALAGCNLVTYEQEESFTLDAAGLDALTIHHDEGDVTITGVEGLDEIKVLATFTVVGEEMDQAEQFSEENMDVELTSEGTNGVLTTSVSRGAEQEQGYLHLDIEVPNHLVMNYRQNEGELHISSMNARIQLQHGSGHLTLEHIQGDVQMTDGAGNITLVNVMGDMRINKKAGKTSVTQSSGDLSIITGTGEVEIREQQGDVSIRNGAGDIDIQAVTGDVTILEKSSGTTSITDVTGNIIQP